MAKRVICECPSCHVDTIVNKADLADSPLVECPACGATMEVDVPGRPRGEVTEKGLDGPPMTQRSTDSTRPKPPPIIAKTAPMHVATPPLPEDAPRRPIKVPKPTQRITPRMLLIAGVVGIATGWIARAATAPGVRRTKIKAYCEAYPNKSGAEICDHFLDR